MKEGLYMNVLKAIFMGILQGATEFLPVSSSGHLALFKAIFNVETETGVLFDVLLHVATLISICLVFYKDILKLVIEFYGICKDLIMNMISFFKSISGSGKAEYVQVITNPFRKFVVLLIITTIPTGIIGLLLDDVVDYASSNLLITGICLICTGLILFISDFLPEKGKKIKDVNYADAFCIGVTQGVATLPGLSRSGTTITACVLCGFDRKFAAKYSFIMSIPAILGALVLQLSKISSDTITGGDIGCYILGMIIAAIIGFVALKLTMRLLMSRYFKYFAFYCLGAGFISLIVYIIKLK